MDLGPAAIPTYGEIIGTLALGATFVTAFLGYLDRVKMKARMLVAFESSLENVKNAATRIETVEIDLAAFKLNIANNYVNSDKLESTEKRLFEAIGGVTVALRDVTHRLDRVLDNRAHGGGA